MCKLKPLASIWRFATHIFYFSLEFHLHPVAVGQNVHTPQFYLKLKGLKEVLKKYRQNLNNERIEHLHRIHGIPKVFFYIKII